MLKSKLLASAALFAGLSTATYAGDLIVLEWGGYDLEGVYGAYAAAHDGPPVYSFIASDDEALQRLVSGYKADVAHPCSQMIPKYREIGLIEPWDPSRITELKNISPNFLSSDQFVDDAGVWFIPADWGASAVAYNTEEVPAEDVASLQVFVDPKYQGRTSLPNSSDDVWALAFLATGKTDWNTVSDEEFAAAADWMRKAHQNVRAYWNDSAEASQLLASGEVLVSWTWNDAVALLQADNFPIGYQREATEGSSTWFCGYVNLKSSPHDEDQAYDFINSWLTTEGATALVNELGVGHSNATAMATLDPALVIQSGLGPVNAPIFAQTPKDNALHERMLKEFENIKAGF